MASQREESMMFEEIEKDREYQLCGAPVSKPARRGPVTFDETQLKVKQHESIFEEIVQELEQEGDVPLHKVQQRRGSMMSTSTANSSTASSACSLSLADLEVTVASHKPRRHSSYHESDRNFHRSRHNSMKNYFLDKNHHKRSSIIEGLFQFQLSVNMSAMSMASMNNFEEMNTTNLCRSCPILTYMNDDDEDSVDLRRVKRPSLSVIKDDGEYMSGDSCEFSDDEDFELNSSRNRKKTSFQNEASPKQSNKGAYTLKLSALEDESEKKPQAKKRSTSYAMLSMRLDDHPLTVLKDIRSASTSSLPLTSPKESLLRVPPPIRNMPSPKRFLNYKKSHDEGSFCPDNKDLLAVPSPAFALDLSSGVGRAA